MAHQARKRSPAAAARNRSPAGKPSAARKRSPARKPTAARKRSELHGRCAPGRVATVRALASALTRGSTVFTPRAGGKKASVVLA